MPRPFSKLTPRGQALRLRKMAFSALTHYDLEVERLRLVTNEFNGIFRLDASSGEKYILRVALPEGGKSRANFEAETAWLAALSRDTGLSIPTPLKDRLGNRVIQVETEGVPEARFCMIFHWVPGSDLADHISEKSAFAWGRLMAELHQHAAGFRPLPGFEILSYDRVFPFPEPVILFEDRFRDFFPPERRRVYRQAIQRAQTAIEKRREGPEPMRVIHGDLHLWNVRWHRGLLSPIDFEDLMWGWPVQDIGTALYYLLDREDFHAIRAAFQAGYESLCPWPEHYPGEIDAFIAFRGIDLVNFVIQSPNQDWRREASVFAQRVENRVRSLFNHHNQ